MSIEKNKRKVKNIDLLNKSGQKPAQNARDLAFLGEHELTNDLIEEQNGLIKQNTETLKNFTEEVKKKYESEIQIKIDPEELRGPKGNPGTDGLSGPMGPRGRDGEDGNDGLPGTRGENGLDGTDGKPGRDGSPDTPLQIAEKVNTLVGKIKRNAIEGFDELERLIRTANALPPATTHFYNNSRHIGRAKNLNFIPGTNTTLSIAVVGDQANITVNATGGSSSAGAVISATDSGDHQNYTLSTSPTTSSYYILMNNGIYTTDDSSFPFSVSGTTLTFTKPLPADLASTIIKLICV